MTLNQELLTEIVPIVEKKIAQQREEVGDFDQTNYGAWFERNRASVGRLKDFFAERYDARFTQKPPHDQTVTMAGVRATSTGGWLAALQNWKRAAENKLASGAGRAHRPSPYSTAAGLYGGLGSDELRPPGDDPINLQGSGPAPIEPREG